jgi:integrase
MWQAYKKDENRRTYTVRGKDHAGVWRQMPASTDRAVSDELARTINGLVEHARYRQPLPPNLADRLQQIPTEQRNRLAEWGVLPKAALAGSQAIEKQIADYIDHLTNAGRDPKHIAETKAILTAITRKLSTISDLDAGTLGNYCAALKQKGRSQRTINKAMVAAKSLMNWLVMDNRIPRSPLMAVKTGDVETDRRRERRWLTHEEWPHLYAAAMKGPEQFAMSGSDRALFYALLAQTGLRAGELGSRPVAAYHLRAAKPYLDIGAAETKNKEDNEQALQPETVDFLRERFAHVHPTTIPFAAYPVARAGEMLQKDLEAARKAWIDEAANNPTEQAKRQESDFLATTDHRGLVMDAHALRHTCAVWWTMTGAHPDRVQQIMRHKNYATTEKVYKRFSPTKRGEPTRPFPHMHPDRDQGRHAVAATGTTGGPTGTTAGQGAWIRVDSNGGPVDSNAPASFPISMAKNAENPGKNRGLPMGPVGFEPTPGYDSSADFKSAASAVPPRARS